MRKLAVSVIIAIIGMMLSVNAMADSSLYRAGNVVFGGGYSGSIYNFRNVTTNGGYEIQLSYFITENWAIKGQYYSNSFKNFSTDINENIVSINVADHVAFTDFFGAYASIGYGSSTLIFPTMRTSGSGLMLEVGLEAKFSPNIVVFLGYRDISQNNTAVTTGSYTNLGLNAGVNFVI